MAERSARRAESGRFGWRRGLQLAIGPGVLVAILSTLDLNGLLTTFTRADPMLLIAGYLAPLPAIAVRTLRWRILLGVHGRQVPFSDLLGFYAQSIAIGTLTPGRVGEVSKGLLLARRGTPLRPAVVTGIVDRLADVAFLIVLAAFAFPLIAPTSEGTVFVVLAASAIAGAVALLAYARDRHRSGRPLALELYATRWIEARIPALADRDPTGAASPGSASLTLCVVLTTLSWLMTYAGTWFYSLSLGLPIGYLEIMAIAAVCSLVASLPISIAGAGTRDAALILILGTYGVSSTLAVALSTLMLSNILFVGAVCSLAFLARSRPS